LRYYYCDVCNGLEIVNYEVSEMIHDHPGNTIRPSLWTKYRLHEVSYERAVKIAPGKFSTQASSEDIQEYVKSLAFDNDKYYMLLVDATKINMTALAKRMRDNWPTTKDSGRIILVPCKFQLLEGMYITETVMLSNLDVIAEWLKEQKDKVKV